MVECRAVLRFVDDMVELIRTTDGDEEQGFLVCENQGKLNMGATCHDPGKQCTIEPPLCPGGGRPAFSFHTHSTRPTALDAVMGSDPFHGGLAKVALLPSVKDIRADAEQGSEYGCVGGRGPDRSGLVMCFRSFVDADPGERAAAETQVRGLLERLRDVLKKESRDERRAGLEEILRVYLTQVRSPCLELVLDISGKAETPTRGRY